MEELSEIVEISNLYELYKGLFTDKQRFYFEKFYFENYSLSEIAEISNVSRAAVHSQIKITKNALYEFDSILHLSKKVDMVEELKNLNNEEVNKILKSYEEI